MAARILVVDDDTAMRELMALALGKEGFDVSTAATSASAVEAIIPGAFDLMVSDIYLGDGSWGTAFYKIRAKLNTDN